MKIQTIIGSLAIAAVVAGCGTVKDGQTGDAVKNIGTVAADGEYVPGLQQGVFRGLARQVRTNFNTLLSCGKSCADADQQTRTLGTILADVGRSHVITNELTGQIERFSENAAILYEGEIYLVGGVEYNFFVCVDDWASIEIDGNQFLRGGYGEYRRFGLSKGSSLIASKTVEKTGWHPIRVWLCDIKYGGASMLFFGMGIGWNDSGCKEVNAENFSQWHLLRDDGSGRFLRTKRLPQKEETAKAATEKSGN